MCYMRAAKASKTTVGVRELRQNLSVYLRRVKKGEVLEISEHGRPVAMISALEPGATALDRLIASGRATRPVGNLLDLGLPKGRPSRRASRALEELKEDRI
jgi:prevent-host-death family protein